MTLSVPGRSEVAMPLLNWIDATDLNLSAHGRDAQKRLPQVLRSLIHANAIIVQVFNFILEIT